MSFEQKLSDYFKETYGSVKNPLPDTTVITVGRVRKIIKELNDAGISRL